MRSPVYISLLFVLYVSSANGQWTMKFEPNISFPVSLVEGTHLSGGFGFDVTVGYTIATDLVIHAGWGKNVFAGDNNIMHPKKGFEESRLVFGGQIYKSLKNTRFKFRFYTYF